MLAGAASTGTTLAFLLPRPLEEDALLNGKGAVRVVAELEALVHHVLQGHDTQQDPSPHREEQSVGHANLLVVRDGAQGDVGDRLRGTVCVVMETASALLQVHGVGEIAGSERRAKVRVLPL